MDEKENIRIVLGIDISTTCLGVSLAKYDNGEIEILKISHVKPKISKKIKGTEALFLKAKQFKEQFIDKYKNIGLTDIVIEEPLPNSQNNNTVTTLLRFNGMISQSIYEATGVVPQYISSYDARKYAFPELMAIRKFNKKEEMYPLSKYEKSLKNNELVLFGDYPFNCQKKYIMWNKVVDMFPNIEWIYNKKNELVTENFDACDSLICVLGFLNKKFKKDMDCKIINYNINKNYIEYIVNVWDQEIKKKLMLT